MQKEAVISFKADQALAARIRQLPNSSEFIRAAILAALENTCPLCRGQGVISVHQREHWDALLAHHRVNDCPDCGGIQFDCDHEHEHGHEHDHEHTTKGG